MQTIEKLRHSFSPNKINILFVGESPPTKGSFFYDRSNMTTFTSTAFEKAFNIKFKNTVEFLNYFKSKGCFLDDICLKPIDTMKNKKRELMLNTNVDSFAKRLKQYQPEMIIIVLKKIELYVYKSLVKSSMNPDVHTLSFPGNGHQNNYIKELTKLLICNANSKT